MDDLHGILTGATLESARNPAEEITAASIASTRFSLGTVAVGGIVDVTAAQQDAFPKEMPRWPKPRTT